MSQSGHIVAEKKPGASSEKTGDQSTWLRSAAKIVRDATADLPVQDEKLQQQARRQFAAVGLTTDLRVVTDRGRISIGSLVAGNEVWTLDSGLRKLRWVVQRKIKFTEKTDHLRPVHIAAGALGPGTPRDDLRVAPGQRLLINDWRAKHYFGLPEFLVCAVDLVGQPGITRDAVCDSETYAYLHFDDFELIEASGVISESFVHERRRDLYKAGALRNALSLSPSRPLIDSEQSRVLHQSEVHDPIGGTPPGKGGLRDFVAAHKPEHG